MTQINTQPPRNPKQAAARRAPIDHLLNPLLFKALCDPTRVALVGCIAKCGRACAVGEIAECCAVDISVVSRHLALLARAGVLEAKKKGRIVSYRLRFADLCQSLRSLADAIEECCPGCETPRAKGCCTESR